MKTLDRKLLRDLLHLRGQMIAVAVVVACGIATYVTMVSVYDSLYATRATYYDRYRFADIFASMKRAPEGLVREIAAIPGVAAVESRIVTEVTLDVEGLDEPAIGRIVSIPEVRRAILNDLHIRRGGYIEAGRDDQVIISEAFSEANNLNPGDSLGAVINGRWKELHVVGVALSPEYVYELRGGASFFPDNQRFGILWMGRSPLAAAFDMEGAFNDVSLRLSRNARPRQVIDQLDVMLAKYGCQGAYGRSDQISASFLNDELSQLKANGVFIPVIFLGVAAFLLHLVLSRLLATQRDQIAVLKAFGYSNISVGIHYIKFAMVAVVVGSIVGSLLGIWLGNGLTVVYTKFYRFPILRYSAGWDIIISAFAISGGAALLGALGAVRRAVALPPAEAMRPEAPQRFTPGILQKIGVERFFPTSFRMIVRSLERNPFKAFLSAFGVALSVAILVVGRFSFDAINYMIDLQYRTAQLEDVTVVFNHPLDGAARFDLAHLPGVTASEEFRSVPVTLRSGYRSRRIGIQGLPGNGDLHRIVDRDQMRKMPPDDGLLLTAKLGEVLDVSIGDTVTVEILEGSRPVRRMVITDLVDELFGVSAYMKIESLNRMLGEGSTISGAWLAVEATQVPQLYEQLKRTPAVAGTVVRQATIDGFNKTIAESQGISSSALIIFASVIAVGIVYNSARISLSEKGRELASLRVLGFTKREVAAILLGEQGLIVLASIPLGFLLGYGISALLVSAVETEMFRMPLVLGSDSYAFSAIVVVGAAILSALLVRRRLYSLDLIEVLKTRE